MSAIIESSYPFLGEYFVTLDAANRLKLPAGLLHPIVERFEGRLVLQRLPEGCLALYPAPQWDTGRSNLLQRMPSGFPGTRRSRLLTRLLGSGGEAVSSDGQGRILLGESYRRFAGILERGQVCCAGCLDRIEIWARDRWERHLSETDQSLLEALAESDGEAPDVPESR